MRWNLAHRPRTTDTAEFVDLTADSSSMAITALRARIPADHVILYVRRVYDDDGNAPEPTDAAESEPSQG